MAIQSEPMTRHFQYGDLELPDPNPVLTPQSVCDFYAATYPELNNAHVEGPTIKGARQVFDLTVSYGSKG